MPFFRLWILVGFSKRIFEYSFQKNTPSKTTLIIPIYSLEPILTVSAYFVEDLIAFERQLVGLSQLEFQLVFPRGGEQLLLRSKSALLCHLSPYGSFSIHPGTCIFSGNLYNKSKTNTEYWLSYVSILYPLYWPGIPKTLTLCSKPVTVDWRGAVQRT